MCWPSGDGAQRSIRSAPPWSSRGSCQYTPTLLTQPPRLVEMDTSGAVVTSRLPTSGASARRVRVRPKASWVETLPRSVGGPADAGTSSRGRGTGGGLLMSEPTAAHSRPSGLSGSNRSNSVASVSPVSARRASIWSGFSSTAWLSGSPAMGRPHPLTV